MMKAAADKYLYQIRPKDVPEEQTESGSYRYFVSLDEAITWKIEEGKKKIASLEKQIKDEHARLLRFAKKYARV